jgi:hypothetical protein
MISSKILKNIPVSISILHDQEYRNICQLLHMNYKNSTKHEKSEKRRALSEKNLPSPKKIQITTNDF